MKVIRLRESNSVQPLHVVMIILVVMVVAGGMLLLSAAKPTAPVDGAIEWHESSPLRAVIELLCLNHQVSTTYAGSVKNYTLGLGAGLSLLVLGLAVLWRSRTQDELSDDQDILYADEATTESITTSDTEKAHIAPLIAAQALVVLYLLWSFASCRWSSASELAFGGSLLLTVQFLWSFSLGNGLSVYPARIASRAIIGILALTAVVAIWYHYGRNPTLRADIPVGNPLFLAACLSVGALMGLAFVIEQVSVGDRHNNGPRLTKILFAVIAVGLCLWGFYLADSRGPMIGLLFGLLAMFFFAVRGRRKWIPIGVTLLVILAGALYVSSSVDKLALGSRSDTMRFRLFAWDYAWRMFLEEPFTGHGQGAFTLSGDSYALDDVLHDPQALSTRIAHAHNEWLEVMADLGSVGIVLIAGALILTLLAGTATLADSSYSPKDRWPLIGLMSALVALVVSECFSVGLRVAGVSTLFYTLLGLIWAKSGHGLPSLVDQMASASRRRIPTVAVCGVLGLTAMIVTQQDFSAARNLYRSGEALRNSDIEEAIERATMATNRLNPQRALTNLYRVSETHMRAAEFIQARAFERSARAEKLETPNPRLWILLQEDFKLSELHCEQGIIALKELLLRSPSFFNHGFLGYRLNMIRARNAGAQNDFEKQQALLQEAAAAIMREMRRQPYDPKIAAAYIRVAGPTLELADLFEVLARPLRHHRITIECMDILRGLADQATQMDWLIPLTQQMSRDLVNPTIDPQTGQPVENWATERLRLAATLFFMNGDYAKGRLLLQQATPYYEKMAGKAPVGAASCFAELAISTFFDKPRSAGDALKAGLRAIELAPPSRVGRELTHSVKQRMVDFYLALGREPDAIVILEETAPSHATKQDVLRELAARYWRLCQSLLTRQGSGGFLRKPPAEMLPLFLMWSSRSLELNPLEPQAHLLTADLKFHAGEDVKTAEHLQLALTYGLDPRIVTQFLQAALEMKPDSGPLKALSAALGIQKSATQPNSAPDGSTSPSLQKIQSPPPKVSASGTALPKTTPIPP